MKWQNKKKMLKRHFQKTIYRIDKYYKDCKLTKALRQ